MEKQLKDYQAVQVKMSRTGDTYPSLSERVQAANSWNVDVFLSIHINAGGGTGYEDFIYTSASSKSKDIQKILHSEIMNSIDLVDRGQKSANFQVLRTTKMPAILTECGFIDHPKDAQQLKKPSFIQALTEGHVNGLIKSFHLNRKTPPITHTIMKGDTLWSIAKKYSLTVGELKKLNPTTDESSLKIGSKLNLSTKTIYHTVKQGDTLSQIALHYGSSIAQLSEWNQMKDPNLIRIGQQLRVK